MPAPGSPAAMRPADKRHRQGAPVVREFMTPREALATLSPEATLREAAELFASRHVAGAPVLAGSEVVGVVSASDLMEFAATTPGAQEGLEEDAWENTQDDDEEASDARASFLAEAWIGVGQDVAGRVAGGGLAGSSAFEEHVVSEVMSTHLVSISPGAELRHAAEAMRRAGVHRLLVLEEGRLAGLVTSTDVLRAVAGGRLPTTHRQG